MPLPAPALGLLLALGLALGTPPQDAATSDEPFPASTALAEEVSPESLARLSQLVQGFVDDQEIVGAELLVLKNGRSLLHEAYGWSDREADTPMATNRVFCVRSMTKPVIGAAILMLIDDDQLALDDRVAQHLPAFDVEGLRDITVEELLTHTSGLPMSLLMGRDLHELDGIQAVAALGDGTALEFAPGSAFSYSDQGTDTLTALLEVVSGMPAAEFVSTRVLAPLGMRDSACVLTEDSPLRARALTKYAGSRGAWKPFWGPADPPLFPFFLGSQGLYSTVEDYARFMEFWRVRGRASKERLLASRYVRKALTPGPHPMEAPTGFPGLRAEYGYLMQLWTGSDERRKDDEPEKRKVVAFGHTGSDGTHAWVFPEENAMVLYFTQSRGNTTGLRVEEALGELFLGAPFDPNEVAPPFEPYLGYYWENDNDKYRAVVRDGEDLALEILGKGVVPLTYAGGDRWKFRPNPSIVLEFDRSTDGTVTGYHIGDHQEFRFEPSPELPSADELAARVARAHRLDLLESVGPLRMTGGLTMEKLGITGEFVSLLAWPDRFRIDTVVGENFERAVVQGERVWYASSLQPAAQLEGLRAELLRHDTPFARFGDWRRSYPDVQVIQELGRGDDVILLVRMGDTSAPAATLFVDAKTDRVRREESLAFVDTLGRIGQIVEFDDFRDVSGMLLPFQTGVVYANPLIGTIVITVTGFELGVALPEGTFELRD